MKVRCSRKVRLQDGRIIDKNIFSYLTERESWYDLPYSCVHLKFKKANDGRQATAKLFRSAMDTMIKPNSSHEHGKNQISNEYVLVFPPRTAMGLELEPVIISTNPPRQIGCRVKDFYFGSDFIESLPMPNAESWSKDLLMSRVKIGDVICKVDNERVVSKSFAEILVLLKDLRNTDRPRHITFRNISLHGKI